MAKQEALEREKLAAAKEQAMLQMQKEVEEKNIIHEQQIAERNAKREQLLIQSMAELEERDAKREEQLLENEHKRQRIQAELQLELEKQRTAMETNNLRIQADICEKREAEHIAEKEKEKQEMLGLKESEKAEMKKSFEQQIVMERKLAEEKAKSLKLEMQLKEQK